MDKKEAITLKNVSGGFFLAILLIFNLSHAFFTLDVIVEEIKYGWGFTTNLEIGVLLPWALELLCIPVLIIDFIYLLVFIKPRASKGLYVTNIILTILMVVQVIIFNLFIYY